MFQIFSLKNLLKYVQFQSTSNVDMNQLLPHISNTIWQLIVTCAIENTNAALKFYNDASVLLDKNT